MRRRILIISGSIFALIILLVVAAVIFVGSLVKTGVEKVGPAMTKVSVKLDGANLSIFSGSGELKGFVLGNPDGFKTPEAVKVAAVAVSVAPGSLMSDKVIVHSIRIDDPEITYETGLTGNNLSKILENIRGTGGSASAGKSDPAKKSGALQVDEFIIKGGKVHVATTILGGKATVLPLPEIRLTNLGQEAAGISPAELGSRAFGAILEATMKAVAENAVNLGKEASEKVKILGAGAAEKLQKTGPGLTDLLKKK